MIRIITDSAADIPLEEANDLNIHIVPLHTTFGTHEIKQETIEDYNQFYKELMTTDVLPITSRPSPDAYSFYFKEAEEKGAVAFIAAAGMAAHLAGAVAASTTKPVIGVPMKGGAMDGMDAMLSTVQMPAGMPVATVALGRAGAINAAYLAMQILAISDKDLAIKLKEDRIVKAKAVESDSKDIEVIL